MSFDKIYQIIYACISLVGGLLIYQLVFFLLKKWVRRQKRMLPYLLTKHVYNPGLYLMIAVSVSVGLEFVSRYLPVFWYEILKHALHIATIALAGLLLTRIVTVVKEITVNHFRTPEIKDYSLRKAKTKYQLIQRMLNLLVVVATIVFILMTFNGVRQLGTTLLASAGVIGLIIGFAAQKSLGTLFAGIQIALTQPIRLDDSIIVNGISGTVSEISLTYVVVDVWDGSRLTIPINHFLENAFQNLTRISPEMISRVKIYVDYSLPVEKVRQEFYKWLQQSDLWDRRKSDFIISAANNQTIELQASMSVRNADDGGMLEAFIREQLITHIQEHYPDALPKLRIAQDRQHFEKQSLGKQESAQ